MRRFSGHILRTNKMAYCTLCEKAFRTDQALRQHSENSPAHNPVSCELCSKTFPNAEALAQHTRDSPAHKGHSPGEHPGKASIIAGSTCTCIPCDRTFPNSESLNQHIQASPKHKPSHTAPPPSPSPSPQPESHPCSLCTHTFTSEEALDQHTRDAPSHSRTHTCPHCPRSFRSASALAQHIRDAPSTGHRPPLVHTDTSLDAFFLAYSALSAFPYDRTASPATSFRALRAHMRWRRDDADERAAWQDYLAALRRELGVWFGGEDDLGNWQALCRAVEITPTPETEKACESALRGRHVNLVDLLEWARSGGQEREGGGGVAKGEVRVFADVGELFAYCKRTEKWFPLDEVEEAERERGGGVVIRHLLRKFGAGRKKGRRNDSGLAMRV